ncbi:MAG TPA: SCO family protein [Kofleriaceae bacterium]|nr:SCO family protein [Kofleriaceae bacterium]
MGHDVAPDEQILPPPPTYKANGVTVEEHLGARVPLDAKFRTQDGTHVTLGEVLAGELPTILTFNYSDCPMLCSLQLNGLTAAMPKAAELAAPPVGAEKPDKLAFQLGKQYRVVTISLEPKETLEKLQKMKQKYLDRLPEAQRAAARTGWTFLVPDVPGDDAAIRRVAETVGFAYTYIPERAEWAHPAAFVFLSTTGVVTRYVYGIDIDPVVMRESIFKAGLAEPTSAVGFMHRCYEYDPNANNYSHAGVMALRIAAVSCLVLLLAGLGTLHVIRRNGRRDASDSHDHNPRPDSPGEVS